MPKLTVHNLGPIQDCEIELENFCVLTGPQASGKSTVAKAIFFFRTIKEDCISMYIKNQALGTDGSGFSRNLKKQLRSKFMQMFGSSWGMSMDMRLRYEYGRKTYAEVLLRENSSGTAPNYIDFRFSRDIQEFLRILGRDWNEKSDVEKMAEEIFCDSYENVYIPAGRSMITLLTSQLNYILSIMDDMQKKSIDYCTQNYMERILKLKNLFSSGIRGMYYEKLSTSAEPINKPLLQAMMNQIDQILKGKYQYQDGEERLVLEDHSYVRLNYTSSGQQEVVWILNLLFYYVLENKKVYMILEEPESHLYPQAQSEMAQLLGMFLRAGNQMLLTTHSPYILGEINNLLYAGNLAKKARDQVNQVIGENEQIDSSCTSAYYIEEGSLRNIMDEEISLIRNEVIDGISEVINEQNDRLVEIDCQE